jgi:hypothetical protein
MVDVEQTQTKLQPREFTRSPSPNRQRVVITNLDGCSTYIRLDKKQCSRWIEMSNIDEGEENRTRNRTEKRKGKKLTLESRI